MVLYCTFLGTFFLIISNNFIWRAHPLRFYQVMKICCQSQHFLQLSLTLKEVLGLHHCTAFLFGSKKKSEILNICLEKTTLGPNDTSDF